MGKRTANIKVSKQDHVEQKLNFLSEHTSLAVIDWNPDFTVHTWNPGAKEIFGFNANEAVGRHAFELMAPLHTQKDVNKVWQDLLSNPRSIRYTVECVTKDKRPIVCNWHTMPVFDKAGKLLKISSVVEEITEKVTAQRELELTRKELQEKSKQLAMALEGANEGLWDWNIQTGEANFSPRYYTMLGYEPYELPENYATWESLIHPDDKARILDLLKKYIHKEIKEYNVEFRMQASVGRWRWIQAKGKIFEWDKNGSPLRMVGTHTDITSRKEMEEQLIQSESRLSGIIGAVTSHLSIIDEDMNIIWANNVARNTFGDDIIGCKCHKAYHMDNSPCKDCLVKKTFADGKSHSHQTKVVSRTGKEIYFWCVSNAAEWYPDGKPKLVIEVSQDITAQVEASQKAEKILKESEMHYRTLFEESPISIWEEDYTEVKKYLDQQRKHGVKDFKKFFEENPEAVILCAQLVKIIDVNQATLTMLGANSKMEILDNLSQLFTEEALMVFREQLIKLAEGETSWEYESTHHKMNGDLIYAIIKLQVSPGAEKDLSKVIVTVMDITETRKESRMRTQLEQIINNSPVVAFLWKAASGWPVEYVSENVKDFFGYSSEYFYSGKIDFADIIHPDDIDRVSKEVGDFTKSGETDFVQEYRIITRNGDVLWLDDHTWIIRDPKTNKAVQYQGIIIDITSRKQAEVELTMAKLQAEEANRAKSAFLANISHEIRTPLNAISGFCDLLLDSHLDEDQLENLKILKARSRDLQSLIEQLLDFSKVESGKITFKPEKTNLRELLDEIVRVYSPKAKQKNIDISLEVSNKIPGTIHVDPLRLKQVLFNLLGNAVKFTENGKISLSVELPPKPKADLSPGEVELYFSVSDTGIGIPKNMKDRVFEEFTQVDETLARKYGGTGLGLAICKKLIENMRGTIWLESRTGKGSIFHFTIIVTFSTAEAKISPATKMDDKERKSGSPDLKILLVEDDSTNCLLIKKILKNTSFQLTVNGKGQDAVENIKNNRYDLVLMDIQMPDIDGISAAKLIREYEINSKAEYTPIIALTAHTGKTHQKACRDAGMDGFIAKPVSKTTLLAQIARIIESGD